MEIFQVDFKKLNSVGDNARRIADKIGRRIDDYEQIASHTRRISESHRNNISICRQKISRKVSSLEEKQNALRAFADKAEYYADKARDVDKRVANRIETSSETFEKQNNIKISFFDGIVAGIEMWIRNYFGRYGRVGRELYAGITEFGRNVKNDIRRWYCDEGGKYMVNYLIDGVLLAVSIAVTVVFPPASALGLFFAGFGIFKGISDVYYDAKAYISYTKTGNKAVADREDEKGGRDMFVGIMGEVGDAIGGEEYGDAVREVANGAYTIIDAADYVYDTGKFIGDIKDNINYIRQAGGVISGKGLGAEWKQFKEGLKTLDNYDGLRNFLIGDGTHEKTNSTLDVLEHMVKDSSKRFQFVRNYEIYKTIKDYSDTFTYPFKFSDKLEEMQKINDNIVKNMTLKNIAKSVFNSNYSGLTRPMSPTQNVKRQPFGLLWSDTESGLNLLIPKGVEDKNSQITAMPMKRIQMLGPRDVTHNRLSWTVGSSGASLKLRGVGAYGY